MINADAFLLALLPYLQSIWYKLLKPFRCTKSALFNKVLAHVWTGAPKRPLCLQEPLKLLIAFCANGPYALDKVSGKFSTGCQRLWGVRTLAVCGKEIENIVRQIGRERKGAIRVCRHWDFWLT